MTATNLETAWRRHYESEVNELSWLLRKFLFLFVMIYGLIAALGISVARSYFDFEGALFASFSAAAVASAVAIVLFLAAGLGRRWISYPVPRSLAFFLLSLIATIYISDWSLALIFRVYPDSIRSLMHSLGDDLSLWDLQRLAERHRMATLFLWEPIFTALIIAYGWHRLRAYRRELMTPAYIQIQRAQSPELWSLVDTIVHDARQEGFHLKTPTMWLKRTESDLLPSAIRGVGRYHLAVPRKFLQIVDQYPDRAKAVLAHELAHIVQGDPGTSTMIDYFRSLMMRSMGGYVAVFLLGQLILSGFSSGKKIGLLVDVIVIVYIRRCAKILLQF